MKHKTTMPEETEKKPAKKTVQILLKRVAAFNKVKDDAVEMAIDKETGGIKCKQDDNWALLKILEFFDTHIHPVFEWKHVLTIRDKLWDIFKNRSEKEATDLTLELTLDEAAFLKQFLAQLPEKECKASPLEEYIMRTYLALSEQLN